jgi:putative transposase
MKYDLDKHHRRSIRLKGYDYTATGLYFITICAYQRDCLFGEIINGEMRLNDLRQRVHACWQRLPFHFSNLELDAFVIMPNHIHGILVLTQLPLSDNQSSPPRRGAALDRNPPPLTDHLPPNATPGSDHKIQADAAFGRESSDITGAFSEPGMAFGRESSDMTGESEPGVAFGRESSDIAKDRLPNAAPLRGVVAGSVGAMVLNFKSVTTRLGNRMRRSPGSPMWQRNYYEHIIRDEKSLQFIRQYIHHNPMSWQHDQLHPGNPSQW